ncbi:MAG: alanine--tRNA ligase-related protein [Ignavibacteriaceae bacterium]
MNIFLKKGSRDYKRAVNSQKCRRVSGKPNDLEEVGYDTYHHAFFEMLGNWSFGDYYKAEAIEWASDLLSNIWKLPKERLWATVYRPYKEALELWKTKTEKDLVKNIIKAEEKSFNDTLDRGIKLFEGKVTQFNREGKDIISGEDSFRLYDTYGFPVDLTILIAKEAGVKVDEEGFSKLMNEQKERARIATKNKTVFAAVSDSDFSGLNLPSKGTEFVGYDLFSCNSKVIAHKKEGTQSILVLDKSPFYGVVSAIVKLRHATLSRLVGERVSTNPLFIINHLPLTINHYFTPTRRVLQ